MYSRLVTGKRWKISGGLGIAAGEEPAGGDEAVVGTQVGGPGQVDGVGLEGAGAAAVPVSLALDVHRVADVGPPLGPDHAEVAALGKRDPVQGRATQRPLELRHQSTVPGDVAM